MRNEFLLQARSSAKPNINVTPLINVLLVMKIIFMVVSPLRPTRFLTKTASQPDETPAEPPPLGLVVTINRDGTLISNRAADIDSILTPRSSVARSMMFSKSVCAIALSVTNCATELMPTRGG